ncbi:Protein of unknown function (DUF2009), putative [Trypanosoma equiperdum]|uniref:Non-canonical E2 ubiquitin-conjugating enzyme C-terminal domain-containing protein n=4 Tax=Trypanozoon TaxID=39700 RepID=Q383U1_TRYB2|nr:hypothetical protein, conserved [Trypanosoma brucei gambiense DAL972]XP_829052.1 hypothetical protein, conserved [Trypanosoma brucei brucei TREU927]RHW68144.1 hypothetical protein DPX39_110070100 [Trypanosoma brucei equiperdum]SCU70285.1 Protein of unknown function (DUF2009), putative [Trypanosoma equiperdum]EAN79940.1 hypothetical protein, conserved [Trypanosoma brucei brucei TREU927]CBH17992.1 hypothetical protein, conserved [Trypanosoma brucei gambiense DAL972]|eukprot:XP_011780256.1 hypothetical protein, conserved [Trypanosoma brucei gambiense DAL972]
MRYESVLLRLSDEEREELQLLIAALNVSEYTDDVDDIRRLSARDDRMCRCIRELFDTVLGLYVASGRVPREMKEGIASGRASTQMTLKILPSLFEIFRRHKRLNPFSNRSEFGKLTMLLQDLRKPTVQQRLEICHSLIIPVKTVGGELQRVGAEAMLRDPDLGEYLNSFDKNKVTAFDRLLGRYGGAESSTVERCLRSIDDVHQFLESNIRPLVWMRNIISEEFCPLDKNCKYNLAIQQGVDGSLLTHEHSVQCAYVIESLSLWIKVQQSIFEFWQVSEDDMLIDGSGQYSLVNTGQGYHRLCHARKSYARMSRVVNETEHQLGRWIGIKVIHLGDRDVPNPLVFIDKYTVIPRIVQPIMHVMMALEKIFSPDAKEEHPGVRNFLRSKYSSFPELRMTILSDFFRHAFDGSGDDGGNCIDGRLTSAWNWCHQLHKKSFYDAFVLTGFNGFD